MLANNVRLFAMQEVRLERLGVCTLTQAREISTPARNPKVYRHVPVSLFILQVCSTVASRDTSVGVVIR